MLQVADVHQVHVGLNVPRSPEVKHGQQSLYACVLIKSFSDLDSEGFPPQTPK